MQEPKRKPDGRFPILALGHVTAGLSQYEAEIWCQNCLQCFNTSVISLAVDKWISKGDAQLQPGSTSRKLGLNDLLSSRETEIIHLWGDLSTDKPVEGVIHLPAEGRPIGWKEATFGWPEVKHITQ